MKQEKFQLQHQNRFEVLSKGEIYVEEMVSKITSAIEESTLDTSERHREHKNEKLKSKTKYVGEQERND